MTGLSPSEAATVQFPMVRHTEEVGWTPLSPQEALGRRGGPAGMLFRGELESMVRRLNPWIAEDGVQSAVETIEAIPPTIDGNREMLAWLRGERQWYDQEEARQRHVQLIDFNTPAANTLHVTWEWRLKPPARKGNRADVMFVINGVPVAIVEHKNPKDPGAIERGVTQLRRYEAETPELLAAPQLFNVTHVLDYWYGVTWNASRRFMARWKERPEESYRFAVQSFFEPTDFLRTLRDWILFYVEDGETRKSVLRQHQRHAIDLIVERCAEPSRRRGLVWHTQGSGKTFTLLTAARLILEHKQEFRNPTVLVVVDRTELEGQLKRWVERLLGDMQQQDIPVWRARNKDELRDLLSTDKRGLILSMIHKFQDIERDANTRDNIYVFIDEAHRSVAKDLGTYLMAALPASTIVGFTGTPIDRTSYGLGTFKIFGTEDEQGYLHKYSIAESIDDETTLPIRHTLAPSDMTVPVEQLDREFLTAADAEGVTDVEELNRVLDRAVHLRTFLTADDRVRKVAAFVAEHFRESVDPLGYKAFLVGVNREACARYKQALDELLPSEWTEVVYTDNPNDSVERPLVAKHQLSPEREADVLVEFKRQGRDPRILIVTDKLLTGFDAPLLFCLYLDKPMRDHVLLQAIARVNRPYVDAEGILKRVGLIVDFVGVLRELRKALQFDAADVSGAIEDIDLLRADLIDRIERAERDYPGTGEMDDEALEAVVYGRFLDPQARTTFLEAFKEIEALWEIVSPDPALRDHVATFRRLAQWYVAVRNEYAERIGFVADLARKTRRLVQESASQEGLGRLTPGVTFDTATVQTLREAPGPYEAKVFNLVRGLRQEIDTSPDTAPVLRPIKERAERVLTDLETRQTSGDEALDQIEQLVREREDALREARQSGLSSRAFAVYWVLKDSFSVGEKGAMALAREAETLVTRFPNAAVNAEELRHLRAALYKPLLGLHKDERGKVVRHILALLVSPGDAEV
ncbi:MAG: HsdR family type I site-specific deoxyribonuclease [Spirochaetaceae bacterium]|nr:HsdR family type I site-specific deoxyribonuclease [Spirochaetaceae bacterium]